MAKIAVVYKSKLGSTKQYAQWIAEETGADLFHVDECKATDLADYDSIVFGGWVRAGGIQGLEFIKKNFRKLRSKKIIVFAVGLNVHLDEAQEECRKINFVRRLTDLPCYYFRGAYDPTQLAGVEKLIMGVVKKMVPDGSQLQQDIENGADYVSREQIAALVEAIK